MATTMAMKRYQAEQGLAKLMGEEGLRWAGTYGSPYPNKPVVRYHAVTKVEACPITRYEDFVIGDEYIGHPQYGQYVGQRARRAVEFVETRVYLACRDMYADYRGDDKHGEVRELTEPGAERATNAPVCQRCQTIVDGAAGVFAPKPEKLISAADPEIIEFMRVLHESRREHFEKTCKNLPFDEEYHPVAFDRKRFVAVDLMSGKVSRSGHFLVERATGDVYSIKAYGRPNRKVGTLAEMTEELRQAAGL